ncbi:MAG: acyclic terpene utilization AtuA family protein, partial [Gammaproteobacteria bacterium]|nr:acyclic terpene utilization AtuA family protein [Gammaproteobacteria bacterium]
DWRDVGDGFVDIGYPIAEIQTDGVFTLTKPANSGGLVTVGSTAEQLLYEIGDPQRYLLPDVACDFTQVKIRQIDPERVQVSGAMGTPPPDQYKVSATYIDGYKAAMSVQFIGFDAVEKARLHARMGLQRADNLLIEAGLEPFSETNVDVVGANGQFGDRDPQQIREVDLKIAVKHASKKGADAFIQALSGLGLAAPPGLAVFQSGRPKPSPVVRLFSFLLPRNEIEMQIENGDAVRTLKDQVFEREKYVRKVNIVLPAAVDTGQEMVSVPLVKLAWGRSGDKGDNANIGIIARRAEYAPWLWKALDEKTIREIFSHFGVTRVERFFLPGTNAINYVLLRVLGGGGVASIRLDPQGKAYAQILLHHKIPIPVKMAEKIS